MKSQRIIALQVSASSEGSCKITISAHTPDSGAATERRRRKEKDFASPSSQSKIQVECYRVVVVYYVTIVAIGHGLEKKLWPMV